MDSITIKFLEDLETRSIIKCENISNYLSELFQCTDKYNNKAKEKSDEVKTFLEGLRDEGLIYLKDDAYKDLGRYTDSGYYVWLDERPISGRITLGGIAFLERERDKVENEKMRQSVINTNSSVQETNTSIQKLYDKELPKVFSDQNKTSNWSLCLAALSIIFIGISAYLQWSDQTPTKVQELRLRADTTSKTLDSIVISLKAINSSIQKIEVDTVYVKSKP